MQLSEVDESGRRRPVPREGSERLEVYDTLIAAIGQLPEIPEELEVEVNAGSRCIEIQGKHLATTMNGVFAGGDVVLGPASVVEAIAQGRAAASAIDRFLGGKGNLEEQLAPPEDLSALPAMEPETEARLRVPMPELPPRRRKNGFDQTEKGYSKKAAMEEASRCLRCDLQDKS
jgi:NADPH-dependent glutamate synthase beta subunit-like oxidoreductase